MSRAVLGWRLCRATAFLLHDVAPQFPRKPRRRICCSLLRACGRCSSTDALSRVGNSPCVLLWGGRGIGPRLVRLGPGGGIMLVAFNGVLDLLEGI